MTNINDNSRNIVETIYQEGLPPFLYSQRNCCHSCGNIIDSTTRKPCCLITKRYTYDYIDKLGKYINTDITKYRQSIVNKLKGIANDKDEKVVSEIQHKVNITHYARNKRLWNPEL